jgi:hypothetical protein
MAAQISLVADGIPRKRRPLTPSVPEFEVDSAERPDGQAGRTRRSQRAVGAFILDLGEFQGQSSRTGLQSRPAHSMTLVATRADFKYST